MTEKAKAIIRIVALFITAINSILVAKGISPLPFDESIVTEVISHIVTGLVAIWTWWKNNNITHDAQDAQVLLNNMKARG